MVKLLKLVYTCICAYVCIITICVSVCVGMSLCVYLCVMVRKLHFKIKPNLLCKYAVFSQDWSHILARWICVKDSHLVCVDNFVFYNDLYGFCSAHFEWLYHYFTITRVYILHTFLDSDAGVTDCYSKK